MSLIAEVSAAAQAALGLVFGVSALFKVRDPRGFARNVAGYALVPVFAVPLVAAMVVGSEVLLAIALLLGLHAKEALWFASLLLFTFFGAVLVTLHRGKDVQCGCFGGLSERVSGRTLFRLLLLLACVALAFVGPARADSGAERSVTSWLASIAESLPLLVVGGWISAAPDVLQLLLRRDDPPSVKNARPHMLGGRQ